MDQARKQQFEGQWQQIQGRVKEKYGQLTDNDLKKTEGKFDRVVGVIKERTGKNAAEIEEDLDHIADDVLRSRTKK